MVRRPQPHVTEVTRGITQSPQAYRFGRVPPYHEISLCAGRPILSDCRSWRRCAHSKSYRRRVHSSSKNSRYCGVAQQKCTRYFIPWGECGFKPRCGQSKSDALRFTPCGECEFQHESHSLCGLLDTPLLAKSGEKVRQNNSAGNKARHIIFYGRCGF